jgi:hypothetical protein
MKTFERSVAGVTSRFRGDIIAALEAALKEYGVECHLDEFLLPITEAADAIALRYHRYEAAAEGGVCSHPGAAGPCVPRVRDGRCVWCERDMGAGRKVTWKAMMPVIKRCGCGREWALTGHACAVPGGALDAWERQGCLVQEVEAGETVGEPPCTLLLWECACGSTLALEVRG